MKNNNAVIIVRLVAVMLTSSVTLLGGYLTKCSPDPGTSYSTGSSSKSNCYITLSTCNVCGDGWYQCFGRSQGDCIVTEMIGFPSGTACIVLRTSNSPSKVRCLF